jgi:signal transduction histidine kinase
LNFPLFQKAQELRLQIAAISLSLGGVRRKLPTNSDAFKQLENLREQLSRLSNNVRQMSHDLHPAILDYSDLASVLRSHCKEFSSMSGIHLSFESSGSFEEVPPAVALCVYRVTQEALQNVVKHAEVADASVHLGRLDGAVCLTVSDRGVGFDLDHSRASGGLGLVSIKERVRLVKGVVELESKPKQGTTLRARIPVSGPAREITRLQSA